MLRMLCYERYGHKEISRALDFGPPAVSWKNNFRHTATMPAIQFDLFPRNTTVQFDASAPPLLVLACSGKKAAVRAPALQLYQGVMYQTYRAHVQCSAAPLVVILSAKHGFVAPDEALDPYDQWMTSVRADEILERLHQCVVQVAWPSRASRVFLAGGQHYRRVMRAAIGVVGTPELPIGEVSGGIGYQRSQLADFLDRQAPALAEPIGAFPNGTPIFRRHGWIEVGATTRLVYRAAPQLPACKARVMSLFAGPSGPTAEVEVECETRGRPRLSTRWVSVADLREPL
ncbi:DUF6884 domain-containing protein [Cupriavidus metallidurans]|uniref:DUF6884 domain-containing protein n=3 Tax=Burkholderiaceae TaxID=119060 RepID=UPI001F2937F3|nr:DUF6884 domain-containing protein [Cupriavidus metallidurans]MDE4921915.1 hypothetical protein [Cupriavidus metallidurans]